MGDQTGAFLISGSMDGYLYFSKLVFEEVDSLLRI